MSIKKIIKNQLTALSIFLAAGILIVTPVHAIAEPVELIASDKTVGTVYRGNYRLRSDINSPTSEKVFSVKATAKSSRISEGYLVSGGLISWKLDSLQFSQRFSVMDGSLYKICVEHRINNETTQIMLGTRVHDRSTGSFKGGISHLVSGQTNNEYHTLCSEVVLSTDYDALNSRDYYLDLRITSTAESQSRAPIDGSISRIWLAER